MKLCNTSKAKKRKSERKLKKSEKVQIKMAKGEYWLNKLGGNRTGNIIYSWSWQRT